jgi:CubicO group peptidase (beta-lactamase class C family)
MNKIQEMLTRQESAEFNELYEYVNRVNNQISASASSVFIIQRSQVIAEKYEGINPLSLKKINEKTRFNVYSVRKSYIGLAVALLIYDGKLASMDEAVSTYLGEKERYNGITIRHLVTHTHGLGDDHQGITKSHPAGTDWDYNSAGLSLLYSIILKASGSTVKEILTKHAFKPLHYNETGWETEIGQNLTGDINQRNEPVTSYQAGR